MQQIIRVLVVDDSALVRQILKDGLSRDPRIEVVATASDPYIARDRIIQLKPDVVTLDVEMPRMDGVDFLRRLMPQYPLPVVMVSSLTRRGQQITLEALDAGAVDFVSKPTSNMASGLQEMLSELRIKVKNAARANVSHWKGAKLPNEVTAVSPPNHALAESTDKVIAIGASTGGTEALKRVLPLFPATMPGIVVVQHMPPGFTRMFAERLNQLCAMEVKEAATGDRVMPGRILIAPGALQMRIIRSGGQYQVECTAGGKVSGHCPSVDVLMHSVAKNVGNNAVGVILTGMGGDGADGLMAMRQNGSYNIAQDEASCVVFGMPNVASQKGGIHKVYPLDRISQAVIERFTEKN